MESARMAVACAGGFFAFGGYQGDDYVIVGAQLVAVIRPPAG
jgi:hypothetical protein